MGDEEGSNLISMEDKVRFTMFKTDRAQNHVDEAQDSPGLSLVSLASFLAKTGSRCPELTDF